MQQSQLSKISQTIGELTDIKIDLQKIKYLSFNKLGTTELPHNRSIDLSNGLNIRLFIF